MAKIDPAVRERLARWLEFYKRTRSLTNDRLAQVLGCAEPTVTNILNRKRTMGLDVFFRIHVRLHRSADELLDMDPPEPKAPRQRGPKPNTLMLHEPEADTDGQ
jgi:transcriptional regulator with XRE-family HTH domain